MQILKEGSNVSTGVAKLIYESMTPRAISSNSRKTFIYKSSEWGLPTEERKEERGGTESTVMISFAPLEPTVTKPGKFLDISYRSQYIPFSPWAHLSGVIWNQKNADLWHIRQCQIYTDHRLHIFETISIFNAQFCDPIKPLPFLPART